MKASKQLAIQACSLLQNSARIGIKHGLNKSEKWVGTNYRKPQNRKGLVGMFSDETNVLPLLTYQERIYQPRETKEGDSGDLRRPKRKVACLFGYSGTGYHGLQVNPPMKTIESELFKAFVMAGAVSHDNSNDVRKSSFMRAARTDKGVHAAGNVVSLKMIVEDEDIVERINWHLPKSIKIWGITRTNKGFDCKKMCGSRVYEYLIPSYTFLPPRPESFLGKRITAVNGTSELHPFWQDIEIRVSDLHKSQLPEERLDIVKAIEAKAREAFRISTELIELVREAFRLYEGERNFHNFTIGKQFSNPSAKRFISSINVSDPKIINGTEWLSIKIHGQSFMLHQIRKMVALVVLVLRTNCPISRIAETFQESKINIPKAPALGLLLERPVFDAYNERLQNKFGYDPISFDPYADIINKFKTEHIYNQIFTQEAEEGVFHLFFDFIDNFTVHDNETYLDPARVPSAFDYLTRNGITGNGNL